jgi:hypothetical protein
MGLFGADDQRAAGGFDDFQGDGPDSVDLHEAIGVGKEPVQKAEVAAGNASDGGDGWGIGEIAEIQGQPEAAPVTAQDEGEFTVATGQYRWANPMRL